MQRRLERSTTDRVFAGVCGGIAEHLAIDATLVRAFFVIASIVTAFLFVLVYIVLLILMPLPGQRPPIDDLVPGRAGVTPPARAAGATDGPQASVGSDATDDPQAGVGSSATVDPQGVVGADETSRLTLLNDERRNRTIGYVLVAVGLLFLLNAFGAFRVVDWRYVWPIALIGLGVVLLARRTQA